MADEEACVVRISQFGACLELHCFRILRVIVSFLDGAGSFNYRTISERIRFLYYRKKMHLHSLGL